MVLLLSVTIYQLNHTPRVMGFWNRQTTVEAAVAEQRFVIEVGHNRNNELIIKKLRVSGDDLETCIADLQLALQDFRVLQAEGGMQK